MKTSIATAGLRCGIIAALAICGAHAAAQPKPIGTIDQSVMVEHINENSVGPALAVVTENQLAGVDAQGSPTLIGTATNGLRFEVHFRACVDGAEQRDKHCKGVFMMSVWDAFTSEKDAAFRNAMASYLRTNPTVNAGRTEDGSPYVVRYIIADFGTKQGNLVSEFANFIRSATEFQDAIAPLYTE